MKLELSVQYPEGSKYKTKLERINLDKEKEEDMKTGKGFIISEPLDVKKTLLRTDSIYSEKYMKTLQDPDAYADRYSCECKQMQGKNHEGMICPNCRTKVKFVGEDFSITGWIELDNYAIIHPNLFHTIDKFIGHSVFESIIEPQIDFDADGNPVQTRTSKIVQAQTKRRYRKTKIDETYKGIGLIEFQEKFDEIIQYFREKNKGKKEDYYNDIINNRDKIFIHNIPVYSTGMRPFKTEGKRFTFEKTNAIFNMMAKLAAMIRNDKLSIHRTPKYRNVLLWNLQDRYNELYKEVVNICSGKKGVIRNLIGGRCGFTSRSVIVPDPKLRVDQVTLSYHTLLELLQQTIINIMVKTYKIGYNDAYMIFKQAQILPDKRVRDIIENIIKTSDGGIRVIINRNPTIGYGSIKAMRCVGINDNYTMGMPLQVLDSFGADFDGDTLNIVYIPNDNFWKSAEEIFDPRNSMMISRNDGKFNNSMNVFKDMIINANALIGLSRSKYTNAQLDKIKALKKKYERR